ncbi:MAG: hypothetical protein JNK64_19530 [Myxococcales bacterium]|nr:hypothetical protein [Myxococcales bacterium]
MPRLSAPRHATVAALVLATLATATATTAAPGPGAGSAPPADTVKATSPAAVETATPTPRFGRKLVNDALARSLVGKTRDAYLGFSRCDAARAGLYLPRCIVLIVGDARRQTLYELVDTKCPAAAPRAACYAGYVIGVRVDADFAYDAATQTSTVVGKLRVGTKTKAARAMAYALPLRVVATVTQVVRVRGGSSHVELKVQAGDVTVLDTGWDRMASGSLTCGDQGELVANTVSTVGGMAAIAIAGYVGAGSMIAGATVALVGVGTTLGAGTPPAVAAGAAVSASGVAFGVGMALAVRELGNATGRLAGSLQREVCERLEKVDQLDPEELPALEQQAVTEMTSGAGGSSGSGALCGGTYTGTTTCEDGSQAAVECEAGWSGGECRLSCVSVCGG